MRCRDFRVIMIDDIVVEPMTEDFILWRCLDCGSLSHSRIDLCMANLLTRQFLPLKSHTPNPASYS
jgi:hypothetical protein